MIPLPSSYTKKGFVYQFVSRDGDVAAYRQMDDETGKVYGYEVFIVQKQQAGFIMGRAIEAKELVPGSSDWGTNAFTVRSADEIPSMFVRLQQKLYNRSVGLRHSDILPSTPQNR